MVAVIAISFLIVTETTDDTYRHDLYNTNRVTYDWLLVHQPCPTYALFRPLFYYCRSFCKKVYGYTATWAGLASAVVGVFDNFVADYRGRFAHKAGYARAGHVQLHYVRRLFYWRARTFEPGMDFGASAWPAFIRGFAVACFFYAADHHYALHGLPPERLAAASACRTSRERWRKSHRPDYHHYVDRS